MSVVTHEHDGSSCLHLGVAAYHIAVVRGAAKWSQVGAVCCGGSCSDPQLSRVGNLTGMDSSMHARPHRIWAPWLTGQHTQEWRSEYERHFLYGEFVAGREYEARLSKTMLPLIRPEDLQQVAQQLAPHCSCIVQASSNAKCVPGSGAEIHAMRSLCCHRLTLLASASCRLTC